VPEFIAPASDLEQEPSAQGEGFVAPLGDVASAEQPVPLRRGARVPTPEEMRASIEAGAEKLGRLAPLGIELGSQIAGQALGPLGGYVLGGAGNVAAQGLKMVTGQQPSYNPIETAQTSAWGMMPIAGQASTMARYAAPSLAQRAGQFAGQMGELGIVGGGIASMPLLAGEQPTTTDVIVGSAAAPALGSAAKFLHSTGSAINEKAARAIEFLKSVTSKDIRPTPGMVRPEQFARFEEGMLASGNRPELQSKVDRVYEKLGGGIENIAANPSEAATVFEQVSKRVNEPIKLQKEISKLGTEVQVANQRADEAAASVRRINEDIQRGVIDAQDQAAQAAMMRQRDASSEALTRTLREAQSKAIQLETARISGGGTGLNPAQARTELVENVIKPMDAAYSAHWDRMYDSFPADKAVFDTAPIVAKGNELLKKMGGEMTADPSGVMRRLTAALSGEEGVASLNALRRVRSNLLETARSGGPDTSLVRGSMKQLAGFIGEELDRQAPKAFGADMAQQFKAVNSDYRNYSNLWDANGVEALFANNPNDRTVTNLVNSIKESGVDGEAFANLRKLIANMASPQEARVVANEAGVPVITSVNAQVNAPLASSLANHVNDLIRSNIINSTLDNGRVDPKKLVSVLSEIGNDPRALKVLKLPNNAQVDELKTLVQNYPEASRMSSEQWGDLFKSRSFSEAYNTGETIASLIRAPMLDSALQNNIEKAVILKNAGRLDAAKESRDRAMEIARAAKKNEGDVAAALKTLEDDPTYKVFAPRGGMQVGTGNYQAVARSLFDPAAGELTNAYVSEISTALRQSADPAAKKLLKDLQGRYILDRLAASTEAPAMSEAPRRATATPVASLFGSGKKAQAEYERAAALLEPEQLSALKEFSDIATSLRRYEAMGVAPKDKYGDPIKQGPLKRGMEAIADMWRAKEYNKVAEALIDPEQYMKRLAINGEWMMKAGEAGQAAIMPLTRRIQERANERQQSPQQNLQLPYGMNQFIR